MTTIPKSTCTAVVLRRLLVGVALASAAAGVGAEVVTHSGPGDATELAIGRCTVSRKC